jgi:hypothetical protein
MVKGSMIIRAADLFHYVLQFATLLLAELEDNQLLCYFDKVYCFAIPIVEAPVIPGYHYSR